MKPARLDLPKMASEQRAERKKTSSGAGSIKGPVLRDVPAVTRAIAILRVLANTDMPIGVVALARGIDAIPSTCLHILRILVNEGLVSFDPLTKKYALGAGILSLASSYMSRNSFVQVLRPYLEDMSRKYQCAFAAIEQCDADHLIVAAVGDVHPGVSVKVPVGVRLPLVMSASGRCFAAFGNFSATELKRRFARMRWDNPPKFDEWLEQIEQTRMRGRAADFGHYISGVTVLAEPVFGEGRKLIGCITTVDFRDRMSGERMEKVIADMNVAAKEVGWQPDTRSVAR